MAIISCPECGKEISDQAEKCIYCGYPLKKQEQPDVEKVGQSSESGRKKKFIYAIAGTLAVVVALVIGVLVSRKMEQDKKAKTYETAVEELDSENISGAKELFVSLGDYSDSQDYVAALTSRIDGVSDDTYYLCMKKLDELYSDTYRENLQKYIAEQGWIDEWNNNEVTKDVLKAKLSVDSYFSDEIGKIKDIPQSSTRDGQLEDLIEDFYLMVLDNAYGREEGAESSSFYQMTYLILSLLSGTTDSVRSDAVELDGIIDEAYLRIKETTDLEGFDDIETIASITFYGYGK